MIIIDLHQRPLHMIAFSWRFTGKLRYIVLVGLFLVDVWDVVHMVSSCASINYLSQQKFIHLLGRILQEVYNSVLLGESLALLQMLHETLYI